VQAHAEPEPTPDGSLLARARAAMRGGRIPPSLEAEILASEDPAHSRAKRILAAMKRPPLDEGEDTHGGDAPAIAVPVQAPEPASPGQEAGDDGPPQGEEQEEPATPELAVLTRLSVQGKGSKQTLVLHASAPVDVGVVRQPSTGVVRFVAKSSGALPAVLRTRPKGQGFAVQDVRRGDDTVQIIVKPKAGFTFDTPRSFGGGARIPFHR
jgi:hypothetical protein